MTRPGSTYEAERFRAVLISTLPEEMDLVRENGPSYRLVADLPLGKFRWYCEQGGAKAIARVVVRRGMDIVGFVGADFDGDCEQPPSNIGCMTELAYSVGQILAKQP